MCTVTVIHVDLVTYTFLGMTSEFASPENSTQGRLMEIPRGVGRGF